MSVITFKDVVKKYGKINALDGASFEIEKGACVGLIGVNGAGKSTIMKTIMGIALYDCGNVDVLGFDPRRRNPSMLSKIGFISESPSLYPFLTGTEHLELIRNVKKGITDDDIERVFEIVGLGERKKDRVSGYSFGMKQRLGMAQALVGEPEILLLDEPTNGLDPVGTRDLRTIVSNYREKNGATVIISSHNLHEAGLLCDCYIFIDRGKIVSTAKKEEIGGDLEKEFFQRIKGV